ncbi:MAG: hypothetical protein H7A48_13910 [Akkermansiaceae bacterium]|nr:hypothetical protein [Akkermansiaceae bacterium]
MARAKKRPVLTHAKVRETTQARAPFRVWYPVESEGGKSRRVFKSFASEDAAWKFAEDKDREVANHGVRYGDIPPEVRRAFDFYRDEAAALADAGAEVPRFEDLVAAALAEVRQRHEASVENVVTVAEGVERFLAYKRSRVGERQLADLKDRLTRFAKDHGTTACRDISTDTIELWLASLRSRKNPNKLKEAPLLAPRSRNHYRANLHAFFGYGASPARGWCERNPVADLEPEQVEDTEPEAYSVEGARKLMHTALAHHPRLVPVLALGMFAGLRVSEAVNVDLAKLRGDEFRVTGKTGPRMVPMTSACKAWLEAQPLRKGKAWTLQGRALVDAMQALFTDAEVDQIANGARHSFISYRTAEIRDVARVADECGNSVSTIQNHYRQLVTGEAAKLYFEIRPETPAGNVTSIAEGRASA